MNKRPLILITGGFGVLGTALRQYLQQESIHFLAPRRTELDLSDPQITEDYIATHQPEIVIHLAAMVFGLGGNLKNQMNSAFANTALNNNLFAALYNHPPKNIFFAGTVASYPYPFKTLPLKEENFFDGLPHYGEFGYAMAKRHAYTYLNILQKEKNSSFVYGVFTNLFGKNDNFDTVNGHAIPSLIAKAFQAKMDDKPLEVWGNGTAERDFLYADDAARAIWFLLNQSPINDIINISSGNSHSMKEVAEAVAETAGLGENITFLPAMPSGIMTRSVDNKKLTGFGFELNTQFKNAIVETYEWYYHQQTKEKEKEKIK